ncbi:MAG: MoxR family ATPase [Chloroflexota bacterium]|nr:MoxR family ATPase [Chloroflexota bacterium]MDE2942287.1 MoxR family ATPase [Chloroflexota bacterium]MDE3266996.1 MoxR family ATPase [Chloroflexota bacterium]
MDQLVEASQTALKLLENIKGVIVGKEQAIEMSLVALISQGHLLIEDVPGLGKTTLAKAIATSSGCSFKRIQFVPDLLPSDITGVNIYNQKTSEFEFRHGPLMTQVVLADEINRAPSKTQAALLESMEEHRVTVDGVTYSMDRPFFIIATLNPVEYHGIFPLPEAELDRFTIRVTLGYASFQQEVEIIGRQELEDPIDNLESVTTPEDLIQVQEETKAIYVDPLVRQYIVSLTQASRQHQDVVLGASHRGSLALFRTAQALSLIRGRDFVTPDDVKELAVPVLAHRLILTPEARARGIDGAKAVTSIVDNLTVPGAHV